MKTITLQTAVQLNILALLAIGKPFSAYNVTQAIRATVDKDYGISDAFQEYNEDIGYYTVIVHDEVKAIVAELYENDLFEANKSYGGVGSNRHTLYNPIVDNVAPKPTPVASVDPIFNKIQEYLKNKGQATMKQIQSALKIKGLTCKEIAAKLNTSNLQGNISEVVVAYIQR